MGLLLSHHLAPWHIVWVTFGAPQDPSLVEKKPFLTQLGPSFARLVLSWMSHCTVTRKVGRDVWIEQGTDSFGLRANAKAKSFERTLQECV